MVRPLSADDLMHEHAKAEPHAGTSDLATWCFAEKEMEAQCDVVWAETYVEARTNSQGH